MLAYLLLLTLVSGAFLPIPRPEFNVTCSKGKQCQAFTYVNPHCKERRGENCHWPCEGEANCRIKVEFDPECLAYKCSTVQVSQNNEWPNNERQFEEMVQPGQDMVCTYNLPNIGLKQSIILNRKNAMHAIVNHFSITFQELQGFTNLFYPNIQDDTETNTNKVSTNPTRSSITASTSTTTTIKTTSSTTTSTTTSTATKSPTTTTTTTTTSTTTTTTTTTATTTTTTTTMNTTPTTTNTIATTTTTKIPTTVATLLHIPQSNYTTYVDYITVDETTQTPVQTNLTSTYVSPVQTTNVHTVTKREPATSVQVCYYYCYWIQVCLNNHMFRKLKLKGLLSWKMTPMMLMI